MTIRKDDLDALGIFADLTPAKLLQLREQWLALARGRSREDAASHLAELADLGVSEEELAPLRAWAERHTKSAVRDLARALLEFTERLIVDPAPALSTSGAGTLHFDSLTAEQVRAFFASPAARAAVADIVASMAPSGGK